MKNAIADYKKFLKTRSNDAPAAAWGVGIRRRRNDQTLDVWFPLLALDAQAEAFGVLSFATRQKATEAVSVLETKSIRQVLPLLRSLAKGKKAEPVTQRAFEILQTFAKPQKKGKAAYATADLIFYRSDDLGKSVDSAEEAYFKLHLLSARRKKPHDICLDGIFAKLPNVAWSNHGPILPEDVDRERLKFLFSDQPLEISHVDKFPYVVNYIVPSGVRIADAARVRLGAHLAPGTTVMPAGFVNFNAGTLGQSMIEGRVSAGVVVGEGSDLGGGASIMGTLSGGGKEVIRVGQKCLIGANAGLGISLGNGCTVAAGLYVTAGAKVSLYNAQNEAVNLENQIVPDGKNVVKAKALSGRDNLLFFLDSQTGKIVCKPNRAEVELNAMLHA